MITPSLSLDLRLSHGTAMVYSILLSSAATQLCKKNVLNLHIQHWGLCGKAAADTAFACRLA